MARIYFYPHAYLRDRQLDTIRRWPAERVINLEILAGRRGEQVSQSSAEAAKIQLSWKQRLPLANIKFRPLAVPKDAVVYVWGALMATGDFIVDLDNPWSLTGYNLAAMPYYRPLLKHLLLSARCKEIRCMSEACRGSIQQLFGPAVHAKAQVYYPRIPQAVSALDAAAATKPCRFLFIGTQFDIKGGDALLRAFQQVCAQVPQARLDVITHLPEKYAGLAKQCPCIHVYAARFSRQEIHERFMQQADVLVLPTYVETFGMVALEALAHGLALIATDVYAMAEMVHSGMNGELLRPPISIWDGVMPSRYYYDLENIKRHIADTDTGLFEQALAASLMRMALDAEWRLRARRGSIQIMRDRFLC